MLGSSSLVSSLEKAAMLKKLNVVCPHRVPCAKACWPGLWLTCGVLAHVVLLAWGATVHSPSVDEVGHMAAGVSHWQFGRFDLYRVNPPLVRLVAAVPVVLSQPETDWSDYSDYPSSRSEFPCGRRFIERNGARSLWLFTIARWMCIPFSLLGAWMCYLWGRDLYGAAAGRLACLLWCFSPTILGQAQMITPDAGATAFGLAAAYSFRHWLRRPDFAGAAQAGIVLGLALLTKGTWIVLLGLWPALWLVRRLWPTYPSSALPESLASDSVPPRESAAAKKDSNRTLFAPRAGWPREVLQGVWMFTLALFVLNLGYGFEHPFERLGDFKFISRSLTGQPQPPMEGANRFSGTSLGRLPLPVPANYALGIDVQKRDFEVGFRSYLRGEWKHGGWWYYYLYAWLIKEPLAAWCLVLLAVVMAIRQPGASSVESPAANSQPSADDHRHSLRDELILYVPAAVVLVLVSSQTGFNHHLRYILPCVPALYVWLGRLAVARRRVERCRHDTPCEARHVEHDGNLVPPPAVPRWHRWAVGVCLAWFIVSSLWHAPHQLSYFNELVGGPDSGRFHLIDSNIDWGQDLPALKRWYDAHPDARPLHLAYFGMMDPQVLGIEYRLPPKGPTIPSDWLEEDHTQFGPQPGWYAISAGLLQGQYAWVPDGRGGIEHWGDDWLNYFQRFQPLDQAAPSIVVFRLEDADVDRVRHEMRLRPVR